MADIAAVLKAEIFRLAKIVIRDQIGPFHSSAKTQRRQISESKQEIAELKKSINETQRGSS